jgi:hypothetical protein
VADPEAAIRPKRPNNRKKLTIQKKLSADDPLQGQGVIKLKDGEAIFGTWRDGELVGEAKIVYPNGSSYVGEMKLNLRHGRGVHVFSSGLKYEGDFKKGNIEGFGVLYNQYG